MFIQLLIILVYSISLLALGNVVIDSELKDMDAEERLQKLMELRQKMQNGENLTSEERKLFLQLEEFVDRAMSSSNGADPEPDSSGPSEEEIAKRVAEMLKEDNGNSDDDGSEDRDLNADDDDDIEIQVGEELLPRWMKRTAKVLTAHVAKAKEDYSKSNRLFAEVQKDVQEMGSRQRAQENRIIKTKAKEAGERAASGIVCSPMYERKIKRQAMIAVMRTLSIGTNTEGGTLLPKPFLAELAVIMEERGIARSVFRGIPMSSDTLDLDKIATKPVAAWTNENALISESDAVFGEGSLDANKLAAITSWSMELEEDAAYAWIPVIAELFAESILEKEDDAGFIGDGTATHGGFTGLINLSGATVLTMATGNTTVADVTLDDFKDLRDQLSLGARRNAVFFVHPDVESILEGAKSSDGEYIYRRPADQSRPGTLWGYPVVLTESLPASGGASTKFAAFGNPVYYLFGTRRGLTTQTTNQGVISDASSNVTYNAFQQDGMIWKVTERIALGAQIESAFAVLQTAAS